MSRSCFKDLMLTINIISGGCIGAYAPGNLFDLMWWFIVIPSCLVLGATLRIIGDHLERKYYG